MNGCEITSHNFSSDSRRLIAEYSFKGGVTLRSRFIAVNGYSGYAWQSPIAFIKLLLAAFSYKVITRPLISYGYLRVPYSYTSGHPPP